MRRAVRFITVKSYCAAGCDAYPDVCKSSGGRNSHWLTLQLEHNVSTETRDISSKAQGFHVKDLCTIGFNVRHGESRAAFYCAISYFTFRIESCRTQVSVIRPGLLFAERNGEAHLSRRCFQNDTYVVAAIGQREPRVNPSAEISHNARVEQAAAIVGLVWVRSVDLGI